MYVWNFHVDGGVAGQVALLGLLGEHREAFRITLAAVTSSQVTSSP